jgi:hypothetical protein
MVNLTRDECLAKEAADYAWLERMYERDAVADSEWDAAEFQGLWTLTPRDEDCPDPDELEAFLPSPSDEAWWAQMDREAEERELDRLMTEWSVRAYDELIAMAERDRLTDYDHLISTGSV